MAPSNWVRYSSSSSGGSTPSKTIPDEGGSIIEDAQVVGVMDNGRSPTASGNPMTHFDPFLRPQTSPRLFEQKPFPEFHVSRPSYLDQPIRSPFDHQLRLNDPTDVLNKTPEPMKVSVSPKTAPKGTDLERLAPKSPAGSSGPPTPRWKASPKKLSIISPQSSNHAVSLLLELPGDALSIPLVDSTIVNGSQSSSFLDLPFDLPMMAPEIPVEGVLIQEPAFVIDFMPSAAQVSPRSRAFSINRTLSMVPEDREVARSRSADTSVTRLGEISVSNLVSGTRQFTTRSPDGNGIFFNREIFFDLMKYLYEQNRIAPVPSEDVIGRLWKSVCGDIGRADFDSVIASIAIGSTVSSGDEKIACIFALADTNGDGKVDIVELSKFLSLIFQNVFNRKTVGAAMLYNGVSVASSYELAYRTANECMQMCNESGDGLLSIDDLKKWFKNPKNSPVF